MAIALVECDPIALARTYVQVLNSEEQLSLFVNPSQALAVGTLIDRFRAV